MATAAQVAANRRNARRSTGPRGPSGKARAARNARRHGLTAAPPADLVAATYRDIAGQELPLDPSQVNAPALRLAVAEVRLAAARKAEREFLTGGEEDLRCVPEVRLLIDAMLDAQEGRAELSPGRLARAMALAARLQTFGTRSARLGFRRMRRYLLAAEREHAAALSAWIATH